MASPVIDAVWHEFILFTDDYAAFCEHFFRQFIHHMPSTSVKPLHEDGERRFTNGYASAFGQPPAIWFAERRDARVAAAAHSANRVTPREDGGTLELLIVQPTPFCNLDCTYCYLPNRDDVGIMSREILKKTFERLFSSRLLGKELTIVWHAGEPLVVPPSFYISAAAYVRELNASGARVGFNVQTNGTLITQEWCDLFKALEFRVGVSLDGPAHIHDSQRVNRGRAGSHAKALEGVRLLKENGIDFHAICVVTRRSLPYADEIYDFFRDLGCSRFGVNIEAVGSKNRARSFATGDLDDELRTFLRKLAKRWLESPDQPYIREFNGLVSCLSSNREIATSQETTTPFRILNVAVNGDFAPFSPELLQYPTHHGRFSFGNVLRDSFDDIEDNERYRAVLAEIQRGVGKCRDQCAYFGHCGGGTPASKYFEHGSFDCAETRFCVTNRQLVIEEVFAALEGRLNSLGIVATV